MIQEYSQDDYGSADEYESKVESDLEVRFHVIFTKFSVISRNFSLFFQEARNETMEEDPDSVSDDSHSQPSERQMSPRKTVKNEVNFCQNFAKNLPNFN